MRKAKRAAAFAAVWAALTGLTMAGLGSCATTAWDGDWDLAGQSRVWSVSGGRLQSWDLTSRGAVPSFQGQVRDGQVRLDGFAGSLPPGVLSAAGEPPSVRLTPTIRFGLDRRSGGTLPPRAASGDREVLDWWLAVMEERYAAFGDRAPGWLEESRRAARNWKPGEDLFALVADRMAALGDSHAAVFDPRTGRESADRSAPAWAGNRQVFVDVLKTKYLTGGLSRACGGQLVSSRLADGSVYLAVLSSEGYVPDGGYADQSEALAGTLDRVLAGASGAPRLVLDLRFHSGGFDALGLELAARLGVPPGPAWDRQIRDRGAWAAAETAAVPATDRSRWTGRLEVLTSRYTVSAGETLVLALADRPLTRRLGETTRGCLSDIDYRFLPNGWVLSLSNQRIRRGDLVPEGTGLVPDVAVPMDPQAALQGRDPVLDRVLSGL